MALFNLLRKRIHLVLFVGVSIGLFAVNYWMMANLPGHFQGLMCMTGANLTLLNVITSAIMSLLAGLVVIGLIQLAHDKKTVLVEAGTLSAVGIVFGGLTSFCTLCTIPVLSLFGLSISLTVFTEHALAFRLASVGLLLIAVYLLNRQLQKKCLLGSCTT